MKKSYLDYLALPNGIEVKGDLQEDNEVNEEQVKAFVKKLKRPTWYTCEGNPEKDTKEYMLQNPGKFKSARATTNDPFTKKDRFEYQCSNCGWGTTYGGIDIGHIKDWKQELIFAGVLSKSEAKAVYNNLNNLHIECATCNRSHDFEEMSGGDGEYEDDNFVEK